MIHDISNFIEILIKQRLPLIDARSSSEFKQGHIPGAVNIPLLNDDHRKIVGTTYKKEGRQAAVEKGFELVGPHFHEIIKKTKTKCNGNEVMLYCWRGGMRSNITAWILTMAGSNVHLLKGGYKTFRNWTLEQFNMPRKIIVLGGKTGSGKTDMLALLKQKGEQIICLETLAHHKGSAYGSLGQKEQFTTEHFENLLAFELHQTNPHQPLWLENESRTIGYNKIPDGLFEMMRVAPVVEIQVERDTRKKRILNEYGCFTHEELAEKTNRIAKRLGGQHLKEALNHLEENNKDAWVEIILDYYDKTYTHSNEQRDKENIYPVKVKWEDPYVDLQRLINTASSLREYDRLRECFAVDRMCRPRRSSRAVRGTDPASGFVCHRSR